MIKKRTGRAESSKKRGDEEEFRYKEERIHEEYDRAIQVDPFFSIEIRLGVQMAAKVFPHLKLLCWLFMCPTFGFDTKHRNSFLIKLGGFFTIKTRF